MTAVGIVLIWHGVHSKENLETYRTITAFESEVHQRRYEVFFGLLSGFKSAVVMPFIIVGVVYYSQRDRFPRWLIPAILLALVVAYGVIEPFRAARNADAGYEGTSVGSIVSAMESAQGMAGNRAESEGPGDIYEFLARINMTQIGSLGLEYASIHDGLPAGSPEFLEDIFLAPVHALVPRFLWNSKPMNDIGLWYTQQVMGLDLYSATAMTPFTYLNFAGGTLAVILGFLVVGGIQRGLFDGLHCLGGGGVIVLVGLLGILTNIDSSFNSFFVSLIRFFPILVLAQFVLLKRERRSCAA